MIPTYRVDGPVDAPVLVLGNSLGTTSAMWDAQVPVLTGRFRVVRYEHPGHGGVVAPTPGPYTVEGLALDVVDLLDHLGVERASLCGVSLGGMVAMWLAAHRPDRVERLVLACTAAHLGPAEPWVERAATVRRDGAASLAGALLGRWFTGPWLASHPDAAASVAAMLDAADAEGYAGCCEAIAAMDQRPDLGAIRAPTLVVAGSADPVTPPHMALELQEGIASSSLVVLAGAAHLANIEQSAAFSAAVVDHLCGAPSVRGDRVRRAVLGDAHVERSNSGASELDAAFVDFITRYAWGEIWTRPGLDRRTRSVLTLGLLAGLGRLGELPLHVLGARRNGLTDAEIGETLLHTAVYAGVPAANAALAVARQVLADLDAQEGPNGADSGAAGPAGIDAGVDGAG